MNTKYLTRIVDETLKRRLKSSGAVLIEGPKWCGKTRTAMEISRSQIFLQNPDNRAAYKKAAEVKPSLLLEGETPRLLDEWQTVPILWDAVRYKVDERGLMGQFLLTGSAVPIDNVTEHTGTGRISRITMRPMSLYESLDSNGSVSLMDLFEGKEVGGCSGLTIEDIANIIVRGGWPTSVLLGLENVGKQAIDYVESIINQDVSRVDGIEKSPVRVRVLLKSLARNISTLATIKTIRDDIEMGDDETVSEKTISQYINALNRIHVIEDIPAWSPKIRSKTTIRTSPKRQFIDPSLATAVMRLTPERLLEDFNTFGFLFESLCDRDLRVYVESLDGQLFHYRDASGLEADAILCLNDGRWAAIEVKMGSTKIEEAANNLLKLKEKINTEKMKEPSFLMILTNTEFAYKRADGVYIVPLGCLKN